MLTVREIQKEDIPLLLDYWFNATDEYLISLGADPTKMPDRNQFQSMLHQQLELPYSEKGAYCVIWELDNQAVGHSNINQIEFGQQASMHLHLWNVPNRQKGMGLEFVKKSIPWYFKKMQLQTLYCEPYALNPAPNKTLAKAGFEFVKSHITIPGSINFEQEVNQWKLTRETFQQLYGT